MYSRAVVCIIVSLILGPVVALDGGISEPDAESHITSTVNYLSTKLSSKYVVVTAISTVVLIAVTQILQSEEQDKKGHKSTKIRDSLNQLSSVVMEGFNYGKSRLNGSRFNTLGANSRDPEYKRALDVATKTGAIGGLVNDGNTCFMNSVLQSLASSNEFTEFLDRYTEANAGSAELKFSNCLKTLISKINGKHYNKSGYYKTKPLMKALPNGPNRNMILGYDQEDAQEFYQMVLKELEREYTKTLPDYSAEKKREATPSNLFTERTEDMIYGLDRLGDIGDVYVPAAQIDPNYPDPENFVYPMRLVTPVDGLSAERIGCTQCGEIGGIRYSVISGLSLNLQASQKSSYTLDELFSDWIEPEIIDDVECNRCGLVQMCKILEAQAKSATNEKLALLMEKRLQEIRDELKKPVISDEAYARLHTKNHIQKSRKIKEIFYSRPPALLTIHINRSVFDPRTYMIRKNGAAVDFPMKLDLSPYVAQCDDINMDARLCFRKQDQKAAVLAAEAAAEAEAETAALADDEDKVPELTVDEVERVEEEEELKAERPKYDALGNDIEYSDVSSESDQQSDSDDALSDVPRNLNGSASKFLQQPSPPESVEAEKIVETPTGPLTYSLKAAISHFGTHNYGHYIAFRKYRGIWWRVSDETVRVTTEREVLNTSGVFMLFYELSSRNDAKDVIDEELLAEADAKAEADRAEGEAEESKPVSSSDDEFRPDYSSEEDDEEEQEEEQEEERGEDLLASGSDSSDDDPNVISEEEELP